MKDKFTLFSPWLLKSPVARVIKKVTILKST